MEVRELNLTVVTETDDAGSPVVAAQPAIEGISKSIWQLTEDVLVTLRSRSQNAVHKQKRPELLWLDDLTETQSNTVIAVRQLCDESPEGVTLKKLAETMAVTPAAASVMVDLLVKRKMLKRTKSKSDRRAVLIRLTPDTAGLFDISEQTLLQTFMLLQESIGPEILLDWQRVLVTAMGALRQVAGGKTPTESEMSDPASDEDDRSTR